MTKVYKIIRNIGCFTIGQEIPYETLLMFFNPDFLKDTNYFELIKSDIPTPLTKINLSEVLKITEKMIQNIKNGEYHDDEMSDDEHYIYEAVMKAVYGENVFEWINKNI